MVVFNYSTRELTTKVVFYGPGLCGKTTNLQFIYDHMPQGVRGKMLSLATKSDRTLFFDFLPIDLGQIQGMKTKVQLYTVPGQVFYNETRRLVLKGADGVVFVADSQENMLDANLDSFRNLEENLAAHGMSLEDTPHVIQYNKRDLPNAMPIEPLNERLNRYNAPFYEAIATTGVGVQETLRHITKLVLLKLNDRYGADRPGAGKREGTTPGAAVFEPAAPVAVAASAPSPRPAIEAEPPAGRPAAAAFEMPSGSIFEASPVAVGRAAESPAPPLMADPAPAAASDPGFAFRDEPPRQEMPTLATPAAVVAGAASRPFAPPPEAELFSVPSRPERPRAAAVAEEEDVLGIAPPSPPPAPPAATLKIDRAVLDMVPAAEREMEAGPVARATVIEVSRHDALFTADDLEPTRLVPGAPQEILVPLEIETAAGTRTFRLTIRLELQP